MVPLEKYWVPTKRRLHIWRLVSSKYQLAKNWLIFGIVDGDKEIKVGKKERVRVAFIDRLYPLTKTKKDNKLTKSKIEMVLKSKGISSEDFARLAVLYILTYALAPTKGYSIGWYYTQFVEDVNSMIKYNWSSFIYDMLMVGLDKEKKGSMGCVLILAVSASSWS